MRLFDVSFSGAEATAFPRNDICPATRSLSAARNYLWQFGGMPVPLSSMARAPLHHRQASRPPAPPDLCCPLEHKPPAYPCRGADVDLVKQYRAEEASAVNRYHKAVVRSVKYPPPRPSRVIRESVQIMTPIYTDMFRAGFPGRVSCEAAGRSADDDVQARINAPMGWRSCPSLPGRDPSILLGYSRVG